MAYVHIGSDSGEEGAAVRNRKAARGNRTCGPEERKESAGEIKKQQVAEK